MKKGETCYNGIENPNYKHGYNGTRDYRIWQHIKDRCFNKNAKDYQWYGERGITLYEPWIKDAAGFIEYVKQLENYDKLLTIDRIDVNGNYEPDNLRWISIQEQQKNRRPRSR